VLIPNWGLFYLNLCGKNRDVTEIGKRIFQKHEHSSGHSFQKFVIGQMETLLNKMQEFVDDMHNPQYWVLGPETQK